MRVRESGRGLSLAIILSMIVLVGPATRDASAVVTEIVGSARARVVQFGPNIPTESDSSVASVPTTVPNPPAIAEAQLSRVEPGGQTTAGGSAQAVFEPPNLSGFGLPNDVGFDLGCFTDDNETTWLVEGAVTERRTVVLDSNQTGTEIVVGPTERARSRILLSGVMLITSLDPQRDLSGVEVELNVSVTKYDDMETPPSEEVLAGHLVLRGGPLGAVTVEEATGAFATIAPPVLDFSALVVNLPLIKAVIFAGVELPYEYNYRPNRPFDLELEVTSQIRNIPGGTGGAAVFGLPQTGLGDILAKVKQDDRGDQLEAVISEQVDTTGAAYQGVGIPSLFPACGLFGIETALTLFALGGAHRLRRRKSHAR
ncbi:MAG TPA: hypothetical protein P5081_17335 [Phycisphaerae bacterium]|nr:hypothetical protein [Phycisphaerae bacterium]HRW54636.1 hypothetical protein [Phycisphaerae bacterium]